MSLARFIAVAASVFLSYRLQHGRWGPEPPFVTPKILTTTWISPAAPATFTVPGQTMTKTYDPQATTMRCLEDVAKRAQDRPKQVQICAMGRYEQHWVASA